MTDEQKEYEAMKLVNLISDLQKSGVIKPAMPGPDGKPVEMEHVLQLQEQVAKGIGDFKLKDPQSDED